MTTAGTVIIDRPYDSLDDYLEGDHWTVQRGDMLLLGVHDVELGSTVDFAIVLSTGEAVVSGEGRAVEAIPPSDEFAGGTRVKFRKLDAESKSVLRRALEIQRRRAAEEAAAAAATAEELPSSAVQDLPSSAVVHEVPSAVIHEPPSAVVHEPPPPPPPVVTAEPGPPAPPPPPIAEEPPALVAAEPEPPALPVAEEPPATVVAEPAPPPAPRIDFSPPAFVAAAPRPFSRHGRPTRVDAPPNRDALLARLRERHAARRGAA